MLSLTCDNASSNDTMVTELGKLPDSFAGSANHTRCFLHIINLVAKHLLRKFDVPEQKNNPSEAERELHELGKGLDLEELTTRLEERGGEGVDEDGDEGDWLSEMRELEALEDANEDYGESLQPVCLVLVKVRNTKTYFAEPNCNGLANVTRSP